MQTRDPRAAGAAPGGDVPAPAQAHGGVAGGEIEGAGHVGAPVDDQRRALLVGRAYADAADVVVAAVAEAQPSEAQAVLAGVERGQQPGLFGHEHVALQPGLHGAAPVPGEGRPHPRRRVLAQLGEALPEQVKEFLLASHFLVLHLV